MTLILLFLFSCVIETNTPVPSSGTTVVNVNNNINTGGGEYTRTNKDSRYSCSTRDNPKITPYTSGVRFNTQGKPTYYNLKRLVHQSGLVLYLYDHSGQFFPNHISGCPDSTQWSMKGISITQHRK